MGMINEGGTLSQYWPNVSTIIRRWCGNVRKARIMDQSLVILVPCWGFPGVWCLWWDTLRLIYLFIQHLYNVGPTSSTLVRHCTNVMQMFWVCRGKNKLPPRMSHTLWGWSREKTRGDFSRCRRGHLASQQMLPLVHYWTARQEIYDPDLASIV